MTRTHRLTKNAFRLALLFVFAMVTQKYTTFLFMCTCLAVKEKYLTLAFTGVVMSILLPSPYSVFNAVVYSLTVLPILALSYKGHYGNITLLLWSLLYNILTLIPKMVIFLPETLIGDKSAEFTIILISLSMYLTMYLWDEIENEVTKRLGGNYA